MSRLAIIIPSRGRPAKALEAVACVGVTATTDPVIYVVVDADDPTRGEYEDQLIGLPRVTLVINHLDRGHVPAINLGASYAIDGGLIRPDAVPEAIAKLDDDHRPRTHGWDARFLDALEDQDGGVVYADDAFQGRNLPTAFAMSTDLVKALGWVMPPSIQHLYSDNAVKDIGGGLGRLGFLDDVVIEHMHPHAGKAESDEHYARVNSPEQYARDFAAYKAWRNDRNGWMRDLDRVEQALGW